MIIWDEVKKAKLEKLLMVGLTVAEAANKLTEEFGQEFTYKSVAAAKERYRLTNYCLEIDKDIKIYKEINLPDGDYMISCDYHSPYHSEVWINRLLKIADVFKIRKHIIIGDLFDFDFAKKWYSDEKSNLDKEIEYVSPVIATLDYFDENYLIQGNHETRVGRITDGKVKARHLFRLFGPEIWDKKFRYTLYDKMKIGNDWLLVHPNSYSQVSTSVAKRLAEKFHRNVINTHGHFVAFAYDRSGRFQVYDLGGMFQRDKIEYINKSTTTHPLWNNGFGVLRNGKFWHFTDSTDWEFWDAF